MSAQAGARCRLQRVTGRRRTSGLREEIARMQGRIGRLPVLDERTDEEILGYGERGLLD